MPQKTNQTDDYSFLDEFGWENTPINHDKKHNEQEPQQQDLLSAFEPNPSTMMNKDEKQTNPEVMIDGAQLFQPFHCDKCHKDWKRTSLAISTHCPKCTECKCAQKSEFCTVHCKRCETVMFVDTLHSQLKTCPSIACSSKSRPRYLCWNNKSLRGKTVKDIQGLHGNSKLAQQARVATAIYDNELSWSADSIVTSCKHENEDKQLTLYVHFSSKEALDVGYAKLKTCNPISDNCNVRLVSNKFFQQYSPRFTVSCSILATRKIDCPNLNAKVMLEADSYNTTSVDLSLGNPGLASVICKSNDNACNLPQDQQTQPQNLPTNDSSSSFGQQESTLLHWLSTLSRTELQRLKLECHTKSLDVLEILIDLLIFQAGDSEEDEVQFKESPHASACMAEKHIMSPFTALTINEKQTKKRFRSATIAFYEPQIEFCLDTTTAETQPKKRRLMYCQSIVT